MIVQIKPELIEWVGEQLSMDFEAAEEFINEFVGMLYITGAFEAVEIAPTSNVNVEIQEGDIVW